MHTQNHYNPCDDLWEHVPIGWFIIVGHGVEVDVKGTIVSIIS